MTAGIDAAPGRRINLFGASRAELKNWIVGRNVPDFHAGQIYRWLYSRDVLDPLEWTDLPLPLRERIAKDTVIAHGGIAARAVAGDGTVKYRVDYHDGQSVECVYMEHHDRVTLCISSQVGCALNCDFCLTGRMGLVRNLEPGEILGQVSLIRRDRQLHGRSFNVVFMGMGEPLHNYEAVMVAFGVLTDPEGYGLSRRRITVSTAGMAPEIERLADEQTRPRLAVSLNATTDELRRRIMPITRKYPLQRVLEACRAYARITGERFTLEYVLLAGVNDGPGDIDRLERLVRGLPAKLNLIPFNAVGGWLDYDSPAPERVTRIRDRLLAARVPVSVRWSLGADARAACGQLASLSESRRESRRKTT